MCLDLLQKKWIEVHDQSRGAYNASKPIRFEISMLRSDLWDYSDAYVWVRGVIVINNLINNDAFDRRLTFKNNASFISCISKIFGELVENAEDLDVVMPMYNLSEYGKNYQKTSGSLFNYYRDEPSSAVVANDDGAINISIGGSKSFDYKSKIVGNMPDGVNTKEDVTIAIPLKHLCNFCRNLDIPLINCEITLNLTWYKRCFSR